MTGEPRKITSKRVRRLVMIELSKQLEAISPFAFDGTFTLYTLAPLQAVPGIFHTYEKNQFFTTFP